MSWAMPLVISLSARKALVLCSIPAAPPQVVIGSCRHCRSGPDAPASATCSLSCRRNSQSALLNPRAPPGATSVPNTWLPASSGAPPVSGVLCREPPGEGKSTPLMSARRPALLEARARRTVDRNAGLSHLEGGRQRRPLLPTALTVNTPTRARAGRRRPKAIGRLSPASTPPHGRCWQDPALADRPVIRLSRSSRPAARAASGGLFALVMSRRSR